MCGSNRCLCQPAKSFRSDDAVKPLLNLSKKQTKRKRQEPYRFPCASVGKTARMAWEVQAQSIGWRLLARRSSAPTPPKAQAAKQDKGTCQGGPL
eukprot:3550772-Amphidinium_carterae.1